VHILTQHFQKISGYKVISKCRNCGARIVGRVEAYYCDACRAKLEKHRAEEERLNALVKKPKPKSVRR
jgi:hypothetical protein